MRLKGGQQEAGKRTIGGHWEDNKQLERDKRQKEEQKEEDNKRLKGGQKEAEWTKRG